MKAVVAAAEVVTAAAVDAATKPDRLKAKHAVRAGARREGALRPSSLPRRLPMNAVPVARTAPVCEAALGFLGSGKVGEPRTHAFEPPLGTCSSTLPAVRLSDAWFGGVTARRGDLPVHPWRPFPRMFASARVAHRIQRVTAPKRPAHPRPVWRERSSARRYP